MSYLTISKKNLEFWRLDFGFSRINIFDLLKHSTFYLSSSELLSSSDSHLNIEVFTALYYYALSAWENRKTHSLMQEVIKECWGGKGGKGRDQCGQFGPEGPGTVECLHFHLSDVCFIFLRWHECFYLEFPTSDYLERRNWKT